jgi:hypothetical protein
VNRTAAPCPADDITDALIPSGSRPANVRVLYGYLWRGPANEVRLYSSWLMDEYFDLSGVQFKWWRKLPFDQGTLVWVDSTAQIAQVAVPQTAKAQTYLGGPIAETFLSGRPPKPDWELDAGAASPPTTALCSSPYCSPRRP